MGEGAAGELQSVRSGSAHTHRSIQNPADLPDGLTAAGVAMFAERVTHNGAAAVRTGARFGVQFTSDDVDRKKPNPASRTPLRSKTGSKG